MRPVNLLPPEDRRGDHAPLRTGPISYLVIGALAVALVAVTFVVLTGNQVKEREAEVASLEVREADATARAEALRPYAEFASMSQARDATVMSLAQSRFDWARVLNELALVIPDDIWLVSATGTVAPDVALDGAEGTSGRASVAGPALELVGCGESTSAVAAFVAALEDVDGVTRVGLESAERPNPDPGGAASADQAGTSGQDCRTRDFISKFAIVAAFDEVGVAAPTTAPAAPAAPADSQAVADAQAQQQQAADSATEQVGEAEQASDLIPGVAR